MRSLFTAFMLIFHVTNAYAQPEVRRTELLIIGTIHSGNKEFDHNTLFELLEKLKPDVILWEQSVKFKRVFGLRTAKFLRIWNPGIEQLALQKYSRLNKGIPILPFDTTMKSRKSFIKRAIAVEQAFYDSLYSAKKTVTDSSVYADFASKHFYYYSFLDTASLERINQNDMVNRSRELHSMEEKVILPMGEKYMPASMVVSGFSDEMQFWKKRNEYMVSQILKYAKQFAGKRIIVLTGLNHKYYLLDKLTDLKDENVALLDFD